MGIAMVTIGVPVLTIMSFIGMRETATKEVFDWLLQNPKIVRATYIIIRLMDDMASHKVQWNNTSYWYLDINPIKIKKIYYISISF